MAWERRKRGGSYYTRSVRENGRVVREYVGTGETAQAIAQLDALARLQREQERAAAEAAAEQERALEAPVWELCDQADLWARVALVAAGYHRHERGEWRRRRG